MPTPSAPGIIRAQSIFRGFSGLPEDRFVTTMHFRTPSGTAEALHFAEADEKVRSFWLDPNPGSTNDPGSIASNLGPQVVRGPGALEVRCYHLGDPEPREPVITQHEVLGTASTSALPSEVAVCLSFAGERSLPSTRGRIYVGPLAHSALQLETTSKRPRVAAHVMLQLVDAAQRIAGGTDSEPARWVVYSPTTNTSTLIRQAYVDDAFDTQRRRGEAPVNRTAWAPAA
jgi:hypothetical protein